MGVDVDEDALQIARKNLQASEFEDVVEDDDEGDGVEDNSNAKNMSVLKDSIEFIQLDISDPNFKDQLEFATSVRQSQQRDGFKFDTVVSFILYTLFDFALNLLVLI